MSHPSLNEWKKDNPGKGINEYFNQYPFEKQSVEKNQPIFKTETKKVSNQFDYISILFSILIIGSFFLPWIDINLLGFYDLFSSSGFELPKIIERLYSGFPKGTLYTIYAIPIGAFLVIIGSLQNSLLKIGAEVIVLIVSILWVYILFNIIIITSNQIGVSVSPFKLFSSGLFLTFFGGPTIFLI